MKIDKQTEYETLCQEILDSIIFVIQLSMEYVN